MRAIRFLTVDYTFILFSLCATAQPGLDQFYKASAEVNRFYFSFYDLTLVIGAVFGLLGGLRVYSNWQSGKQHIDAQVMGWFFSCLFLSIVGNALKAIFATH